MAENEGKTLAELLEEDAEFFQEAADLGQNVDTEQWAEIMRERAEMARRERR